MKLVRFIRGTVVALTCMSLLTAQIAQAAVAKAVRDVALQSSGVLQGQVLNAQGIPQSGIEVAAVQQGQALAIARTDQQGRFALSKLRGGVYELHTPGSADVYRVWAPSTAPPAAQQGVMIVTSDEVVRGEALHGLIPQGQGSASWLANPWVLAAIVAAAIAIPLAASDSDSGS